MCRAFIFIIGLATASISICAQSDIAVAPAAMNVLYRGLANPIDVAAAGVDVSNTTIVVSNSDSTYLKNGQWMIWPGARNTCSVQVIQLDGSDSTKLGTKQFRVKNVPLPRAFFGGQSGNSNIKWKHAMAAQGVVAKMEHFEFDLRFDIVGYEMVLDSGLGPIVLQSIGPRIHKDAHAVIRTYVDGGNILIRDIRVKDAIGRIRVADSISLTVVPNVPYGMQKVDLENRRFLVGNIVSSAQPSKVAFKQIDLLGAKHVLNLRRRNIDKRFAKDTELTIHHVPIRARKMSEEDIVNVLRIIDRTHYNVLIHCKHGSDRTGAVVAAYRVIHQGWTKEQAILEMRKKRYGYHEKLFPNLIKLIEGLDVEGIRNELGIDRS